MTVLKGSSRDAHSSGEETEARGKEVTCLGESQSQVSSSGALSLS